MGGYLNHYAATISDTSLNLEKDPLIFDTSIHLESRERFNEIKSVAAKLTLI